MNGCQTERSGDFVEWVKTGVWDNFKRKVVAFVQTMWGNNNQFAIDKEEKLADMLGIEFTGIKCNGERMVRYHKGCAIAALLVKIKGSIIPRSAMPVSESGKSAFLSAIKVPTRRFQHCCCG